MSKDGASCAAFSAGAAEMFRIGFESGYEVDAPVTDKRLGVTT
jgi:hypothetical protein